MARVVLDLVLVRGPGDELVDQRMLRREHEERGAEQRVRPRREDREVDLGVVDAEDDLGPLGAADPVALHPQDAVRPRFEQLHLVQQPVRVGRDLEQPLLEVLRLDFGAAALAAAVDHLLVREHRLVVRAPLDGNFLPVCEPLLEEPQEQPLRPAVVLGPVGGEDAVPVDRPADPLHLAADPRDVPLCRLPRRSAFLDRSVLRRQPEGIEAHRAQHGEAAAAPEVHDDLPQHVVADVAHVQLAGRIREHLEDVGLALLARAQLVRVRVRNVEGPRVPPDALPFLLDRLRLVRLHHASGDKKASRCERPGEAAAALAALAS